MWFPTGCPWRTPSPPPPLAPARSVGLEGEIGSLAVGKRADFLLLSKDLELKAVYVEGEQAC